MLKVRLNVKDDRVQLVLEEKRKPTIKPVIAPGDIKHLRKQLSISSNLYIHPRLLDQSRMHPRYARKYNMHSYATGLSFIGDAFINFVAAVLVYDEFGNYNTRKELVPRRLDYTNHKHLAFRTQQLGWSSFIASNSDTLSIDTKKGEKAYANMLEGLIGCLYNSNDLRQLPEILETVKNILAPDSNVSFLSRLNYDSLQFFAITFCFLYSMTCMFVLYMLF